MIEEASLEFRLRKTDKTRNYLLDEAKYNDLVKSEKYEKKYKCLNFVENLLIEASTIAGCVSTSSSSSLVCVPVGITSSAVGINILIIAAGNRSY